MTEQTSLIPKTADPNIDRGWAWMVLLGSSLCHLVFVGYRSAIGIYYVEIQNYLHVDIVGASIIGALSSFFFFFGVVLASPLTNKFGCRKLAILGSLVACLSHIICMFWMSLYVLYIFLGVFQGLGLALTYSSSIMVINGYFNRARAMGLVFINLIGNFGQILFSPFLSFLLQTYSLKGVFLISAGLCLQMTVGAMLYFPQGQRKTKSKSDSPREHKTAFGIFLVYFDKLLWTNPVHYMATTSAFLFGIANFIPITLLPDYLVNHGISIDIAAMSVSAIAVTGTLSKLIISWSAYKFPRSNRVVYILSGILSGCLLFIVPACRTADHYLALLVVYGLPYGVVACLMPVLLVELFGSSRLPECFGIINLATGLGSLIGSPLAGYLGETIPVTGIEFIVCGFVYILTGLVMTPTICNNWCYKQRPLS